MVIGDLKVAAGVFDRPDRFRGQHVQGLTLSVEAADEAPAGALLPGEPAAVLEDDEPHAATVAAVPSARPPASSQLLSGPRRCLNLFVPIVPFISIFLVPFRSVQATHFSCPEAAVWLRERCGLPPHCPAL